MEYIELVNNTNYKNLIPVLTEVKIQETEIPLSNKNVIKNISFDQSEILHNILLLYNNGETFDCDMTASELKFYNYRKGNKYTIKEPKYLFDVYPMREDIKQITPFNPLPLEDKSIHSIVCDLPFVISPHTAPSAMNPKKGSNLIQKRFSSWYPYMDAYENMYYWIKEMARVINDGGIIVYKMQNTISGSVQHSFEEFAFMCAQKFGLYPVDKFILQAKARLISSSKIKKQQHARKYTSVFYVFQKNDRMLSKSNCFDIIKHCDEKFE